MLEKFLSIEDATIVLAFFTLILAITTVLSIRTNQEEQKTDRKLKWIEKSLEKLYYPLIDFLKSDIRVHNAGEGIIHLGDRRPGDMQSYEFKNFSPYLYLATNDLKSPLNEFMEMILDFNPKRLNEKQIRGLHKKVYEIVANDVEKFKNQLTILIERQ